MIAAGPGYLGYGASLLWTNANAAPLYAIAVTPGNVTVRRNSDQLITAHVTRMRPGKARLFARYQSSNVWEPAVMQAAPDSGGGATYQFVFAGLPENVEYYVAAGPLVSSHYKVRVVDLPSVKEISVTYHYPAWTGMKPSTEEHSGDLRAIEGTDAAIEVKMDRPLKDGQLTLDDGQAIPLTGGAGNTYKGSIHMEKDGAYHVAATDEGQQVRLSEDYFIATDKALPPEISIERPGGDYRASPIEEVTVGVKAADQFGLNDMHLHYSVNGGPDRDVDLLKSPGAKSADGSYTLPLEDFKLVPGDLVSLYATARDGHSEARTDIAFIQVEPFEREFSQSQQSGGGGGGGGGANNQTEISKREKELIAATWKQQNDKTATPKDAAAAGQFLSDAQEKLRDQVAALSIRMQSRDISEANEEFTDFDKDMQDAAAAMAPSAEKLKGMQWKDAIPLEQKALQALLRAEATFRKIEVAFGQQGGAGGGGGNAGRDLASLFDLELDTEKNQYETAQTASPAQQHEKDVEDALEKLDALAKRQEELANQQHNPQQSFQERWQQEMLRREAEQLQRQMEQLARNGQQGANGAQQDSQQQSSSSQNGSQSSRQQPGGQSSRSSGGRIRRSANRASAQTFATSHRRDEAQRQPATERSRATGRGPVAPSLESARRHAAAARLRQGGFSRERGRPIDAGGARASRPDQQVRRPAARPQRRQISTQCWDAFMNAIAWRKTGSNSPTNCRTCRKTSAKLHAKWPPLNLALPKSCATRCRRWMSPISTIVCREPRTGCGRGINPNANGTEGEIAQGLGKLDQQLQQAQRKVDQGQPGQRSTDHGGETTALDQVESLRKQLEAMAAQDGGRSGEPGQNRAGQSGDVRNGGGRNSDGTVWGNINTGNNRYGQPGQPSASAEPSGNPADTGARFSPGPARAEPAPAEWSVMIRRPRKRCAELRAPDATARSQPLPGQSRDAGANASRSAQLRRQVWNSSCNAMLRRPRPARGNPPPFHRAIRNPSPNITNGSVKIRREPGE